jgi:hypothetical protein
MYKSMEAPSQFGSKGLSEDVRQVLDAAAILHLREYDLFRLAWWRWFGRDADDKTLERRFVAYMFHQVVPLWVRQFCREVLTQEREHRLDPRAFGVDRVARRQPPAMPGRTAVLVAFAVAMLLYILLLTAGAPAVGGSLACDGGAGLKFFSDLSHALAGRAAPDCLP